MPNSTLLEKMTEIRSRHDPSLITNYQEDAIMELFSELVSQSAGFENTPKIERTGLEYMEAARIHRELLECTLRLNPELRKEIQKPYLYYT